MHFTPECTPGISLAIANYDIYAVVCCQNSTTRHLEITRRDTASTLESYEADRFGRF
jgi:hypothetical protein